MLYHLLIATLSITALCGLWMAIQGLARRQTPHLADDADVLACALCSGDNPCHCGLRRLNSESTVSKHKEYIDDISHVADP